MMPQMTADVLMEQLTNHVSKWQPCGRTLQDVKPLHHIQANPLLLAQHKAVRSSRASKKKQTTITLSFFRNWGISLPLAAPNTMAKHLWIKKLKTTTPPPFVSKIVVAPKTCNIGWVNVILCPVHSDHLNKLQYHLIPQMVPKLQTLL